MRFIDFVRQQGYRPYHGAVSAAVYAYFRCENPGRAQWFHKPGSYQCAGCRMQCETDSAEGFQILLMADKTDA